MDRIETAQEVFLFRHLSAECFLKVVSESGYDVPFVQETAYFRHSADKLCQLFLRCSIAGFDKFHSSAVRCKS